MALMAVLRFSSRSKASRLDFWRKKSRKRSPAKAATMTISKTVKPFLFIAILGGTGWDRTTDLGLMSPTL